MPEVPWPAEMLEAELHWIEDEDDLGALHFVDPKGENAVIHVTRGPDRSTPGWNIWHIAINGDVAVVSPSVHFIGRWHSPNPVSFKLINAD